MLDIGDAVQHAGCPVEARKIYDDALRTFAGSTHADLYLRAQFAIAYMVWNSDKGTTKPAQAASASSGARATAP
jgi:hypothetical protein